LTIFKILFENDHNVELFDADTKTVKPVKRAIPQHKQIMRSFRFRFI